MGKLDVQSTVTLIINGEQSKTSLKEVTQAVNATTAALANMKKADDPKLYQEKVEALHKLKAAQTELRNEIFKGAEAQKGFFADFKKGFSELEEIASRVTIGTLIYKGVSSILEGVKEIWAGSVKAFEEADLTQTALQNKLKQTGSVAGETKESLEAMQKTLMNQTGIDDDVIAKGEDVALTYTNIRGVIYNQMIPAAVNLAAAQNNGKVTMEAMSSAADSLGKALDAPINAKKALKSMGIILNDQLENEIKTMVRQNNLMGAQQLILNEVNKRYGNLAETLSTTDVGAMQRYETRIGNIQEVLGQWIIKGKRLAIEVLNPFLGWMEDVINTPLSEKLHEDQRNLLGIRIELESNNTSIERRHKLIDDLKEQYPGYLSQLDTDKTKNSELLPILDKINEAFVLRIAYQQRAEKLDKSVKEQADAMNETYDTQQKLILRIADIQQMLSEDGIKFTIKGNTENEKAFFIHQNLINAIREQAKSNTDLNQVLASNKYEGLISSLVVYSNQLVSSKKNLKETREETKKLTEDLTNFKKSSGYNDTIPGADLLNTLNSKITTLKTVMEATKKGTADYIKMVNTLAAADNELKNGLKDAGLMKKVPGTIADIDELTKPHSGPTQAERDADQKKAEALAKQQEAEKKAREEYLAQSKALDEKLREIGADQLVDTLTKNQKEVKSVEDKYDKEWAAATAMITKLRGNKNADEQQIQKQQDKIDAIGEQKAEAVRNLRIKHEQELADKIKEIHNQISDHAQTALEKDVTAINAKYDAVLKTIDPNNQGQIEQVELARQVDLNAAILKNKELMLQKGEELDDQYNTLSENAWADKQAVINKQYDKELADLQKSFDDKLVAQADYQKLTDKINRNRQAALKKADRDKAKEYKDAAIEAAQDISNMVFTIGKNNRDAETNEKIKSLEDQKDKELSNANLTADQRTAINKKYAEQEAAIKLEQWKADKEAAEKQAIINTALAVVKALPNFVLAGLALVAGIAEVAVISSQKPPQFAKGGVVAGPSHADGGIDLVNGNTGQPVANVEGGETVAVFSRQATANNQMLISELLYNSQYRNGAPVRINTAMATIPASGYYANGGIIATQARGGQSAPGNTPAAPGFDMSALVAEMRLTREAIKNQQVTLNYHYLKRETDKNVQLENNSKA